MSSKLVVKQALGRNPTVKNCLTFVGDHHLAYACGFQVVIINIETKEQAFIQGTFTYQHQSLAITAIAANIPKKVIAVAEKVEPHGIITFYDSLTLRKKRVLSTPELASTEIRCMTFSDDGKYLLTQGAGPEWMLVLWGVEKGAKVLDRVKMSLSDDNPINRVSFCPWDPTVILVLGKSILRLFHFVEGQLRPMTITLRRDQANFISYCWLTEEQLVVGTETGEILIIENFEVRGHINTAKEDQDEVYPVLSMCPTARGFIIGSLYGELKVFEKKDDIKEKYQLEDTYYVPGEFGHVQEFALGAEDVLVCGMSRHQILSCAVSSLHNLKNNPPTNTANTASNSSANNNGETARNLIKTEEKSTFDTSTTALLNSIFSPIFTHFHIPNSSKNDAEITGIDTAIWKSILVTCGRDHTVRVFNPLERKMELTKEFEEEPLGISVHPSGVYIAVMFTDKIRIMSILLDEIYVCREIPARQVSFIKFSHGGEYLAAANGTNLQIYSTYTGVPVATLRGHNNRIKSVIWMNFDSRIITVGTEGIVYAWDIFPTVVRRNEHYPGNVPLFTGVSTSDGSSVYIASHDRTVKQLAFGIGGNGNNDQGPSAASTAAATLTAGPDSSSLTTTSKLSANAANNAEGVAKITKSVELPTYISTMLYDEGRKLLLMGTSNENGANGIVITTTPFLPNLGENNNANLESNNFHAAPITALCLSHDGNTVYSADANGVIIISEYENAAAHTAATLAQKTLKQREGTFAFEFIDEVVIHRSDLELRKLQIETLKQHELELIENNEHQMRVKELEFKDKLTEISTQSQLQLRTENIKYEELDAEKQNLEKLFYEKVRLLEEKHAEEIRNMEGKYKQKYNSEENRHKMLLQETKEAHDRWNEENRLLVQSHQKFMETISSDYELKIINEQHVTKDIQLFKSKISVFNDGLQQETENQGDVEIADLKIRYDNLLKVEREVKISLDTQHIILERQLQSLQKEIENMELENKRMKDKHVKFQEGINTQLKDIQSHKKEIREREETINDKDKRIFDLKKKNQELEKFRFVLDYKIKELKLQIAPRETEIATMSKQIEEMNSELDQYNKSNLALKLMIEELKLKIEGIKAELNSQDDRCAISERFLEKFRRDLQELWILRADSNNFKLAMIKMYRIYVQEDTGAGRSAGGEGGGGGGGGGRDLEDPQQVYNRDREQMERSLDSLRRAMKTEAIAHRRDLGKMMRESVLLTKELNTMRKNARGLYLQKKAIEQAGELNIHSDLTELIEILNLQPSNTKKNNNGNTNSNTTAEVAPPTPPTSKSEKVSSSRQYRGGSGPTIISRTAALRTTSAEGVVTSLTSKSNKLMSRQDQWEAWREIQIQYDTMKELEDRITEVCNSLGLDAIPVIVSVDTKLGERDY